MPEHLDKAFNHQAVAPVSGGTGISKPASDDFRFRTRLPRRHPGLQARDYLDSHFSRSERFLGLRKIPERAEQRFRVLGNKAPTTEAVRR